MADLRYACAMGKPKLTKDDWASARVRWETDPVMSVRQVATALGVSSQSVEYQIKKNGWKKIGALQGVNTRAQFAADRLARFGITKQKTDAIEAAVDIRASVLERHRDDWVEHRAAFSIADVAADFEAGKRAKISAEMIRIRQDGERRAYGMDDAPVGQGASVADALLSLADKLPG